MSLDGSVHLHRQPAAIGVDTGNVSERERSRNQLNRADPTDTGIHTRDREFFDSTGCQWRRNDDLTRRPGAKVGPSGVRQAGQGCDIIDVVYLAARGSTHTG